MGSLQPSCEDTRPRRRQTKGTRREANLLRCIVDEDVQLSENLDCFVKSLSANNQAVISALSDRISFTI